MLLGILDKIFTRVNRLFQNKELVLKGFSKAIPFLNSGKHLNLETPLKWFFAYNVDSNPRMSELIKVAVITAQKNTNLDPYCLYDGKQSDTSIWLEKKGVKIIFHRSVLSETVIKIFGDNLASRGGRGALLRVDLPKIMIEKGFDDQYVLYTDCDVMFLDSLDRLKMIKPPYFACAPEAEPNNWDNINTGVMLMNVAKLYKTYDGFISFIQKNMQKNWAWDQTAYNLYYKGKNTKLPIEYNWRPYWGNSPDKKIIHFHGPKPIYGDNYDSLKGTEHEVLFLLYNKDRKNYKKMFQEWRNILAKEG